MSSIHTLPGLNSAFSFLPTLLHPDIRANKTHSDIKANNVVHAYGFLRYFIFPSFNGSKVDFAVHISGSKKQNTEARGAPLLAARWVHVSNQADLLAFIMASALIGASSEIISIPLPIMLYIYSDPITAGVGCWNGFLTNC
jgi:hypothetical protein